jgi:hypothetical protein
MAKAPLTYIVSSEVNVPAHASDPSNEYTTVQEEMVARMPHTHTAFREDNIAVWDIIRDSIHDTEAFSWVKRCERRRDGRAAYLALTLHYLGDAKNELLRNAADNTLLTTFYGGEKNRFNWTGYVSVHKECHDDLEATGTAMPEDDKVRRLLIRTMGNKPRLRTSVKGGHPTAAEAAAVAAADTRAGVDAATDTTGAVTSANLGPSQSRQGGTRGTNWHACLRASASRCAICVKGANPNGKSDPLRPANTVHRPMGATTQRHRLTINCPHIRPHLCLLCPPPASATGT